jgi:transposase-like protein
VKPISFKRHRFPAYVIRHAVWLYFRFSFSFRDVEELLAQRGIDVRVLSVQRELVSTERSQGRGGETYAASVCHSARAAERWALYVSRLMR